MFELWVSSYTAYAFNYVKMGDYVIKRKEGEIKIFAQKTEMGNNSSFCILFSFYLISFEKRKCTFSCKESEIKCQVESEI